MRDRLNRDREIKTMTTVTRINIPLSADELQSLLEVAKREFRHPRDQARWLLRQALGLEEQSGAAETVPEG